MKAYLYTKYIILAIIGGIVNLGKLLISWLAVCGLLVAVAGGPLPLIKFLFNPEIFSSADYGELFLLNYLASILLAAAGFIIKEACGEDLLTIREKVEADLSKKTKKTEDAMVGSIEIVQTGGLSMYEKIEEGVSRSMNQREKNKTVTRGYKIYSVYSVDHIEIRYATGDVVYNRFSSDGDYMATGLKEFDVYKPIGKVKTSVDIEFGAFLKSSDLKNLLPKFYEKCGDGSEWYLFVCDEPFEE